MTYSGLPRQTMTFLAGLAANNNRDWFEDHRADYESHWRAAGLDLIAALSVPADGLRLIARPKLNASLRRINRDVRFAKDKQPYNPQLHLILSTGDAFNKVPGVHFIIGAQTFGFGVGHYGLAPDALERYRQKVSLDPGQREFLALLDRAKTVGCSLDDPDLMRPPRGYAAGPMDHLIRRKSVIVRNSASIPVPDWLFTPQAVENLTEISAKLAPIAHWLAKLL